MKFQKKTERKTKQTETYYMTTAERLHDAGRWFSVSVEFMMVMPLEQATVVSYLTALGRLQELEGRTRNKFFRCSARRLCNRLSISKRQHERIIKWLVEKEYITRMMYGNPARRWIKVNVERIEEEIQRQFVLVEGVSTFP